MKKNEIAAALAALKEIKLTKIEDKDFRNLIIDDHFILLDVGRKVDAKVEDSRKVFLEAHKADEKAVNELNTKIAEALTREEKVAFARELREKHKDYLDAVKAFNDKVDSFYAEEVTGLKPIDREKFIEEMKKMDEFKLSWVEALYPLFVLEEAKPKKK